MDVALFFGSVALTALIPFSLPVACCDDHQQQSDVGDEHDDPQQQRFLKGSKKQLTLPITSSSSRSKAQKRGFVTLPFLSTVRLTLLFSFWLFSLSILEATPLTWIIVISHDETKKNMNYADGSISLTGAYRFVLWCLCLVVVFLIPARIGIRIVLEQQHVLNTLTATCCCCRREQSAETIAHPITISPGNSGDDHDGQKNQSSPRRSPQQRKRGLILTALLFLSYVALGIVRWVTSKLWKRCRHRRRGNASTTMTSRFRHKTDSVTNNNESKCCQLWNQVWRNLVSQRPGALVGGLLGVAFSFTMLTAIANLVVIAIPATESVDVDDYEENDEIGTLENFLRQHWLRSLVTKTCALGIFVSSVLNGFASVAMPHSCLAGIYMEPLDPQQIAKAQDECQNVMKSLTEKRYNYRNLLQRQDNISLQHYHHHPGSSSDGGGEIEALATEIWFLETLGDELRQAIVETKEVQQSALDARTPFGRIKSWMGVAFSIILLIRLVAAFLQIVSLSTSTNGRGKDSITTALLWLLGHEFVTEDQYRSFSQFVSLLLTGVLSVSQVQYFLRITGVVHRKLNHIIGSLWDRPQKSERNQGNYYIMYHLIAAVMGCYFLTCVVLTKMNLPLEYRSAFSAAMGGDNRMFAFDAAVVNSIFCASAIGSAVILGLIFGITRQNNADNHRTISLHHHQERNYDGSKRVAEVC
eukprot:CAMPEP_0198289156 /NCGR_PEP_ID=MMETSP1449-20131203/7449_1 /TAXON_ID=420275 /ORGANISM="Attheya septentrionalis, Strain CCMP2084" /LENGTH=697 /DNA_ID=CAMNT_0043987451 /DNA_START=277 /DNA_END=2370 /DNA_ORIENTATION=-